VTYQVSHPYKTAGKIMVLYILIFKVLEKRGADERLSRIAACLCTGYTLKCRVNPFKRSSEAISVTLTDGSYIKKYYRHLQMA
jgi:hypothetical protein